MMGLVGASLAAVPASEDLAALAASLADRLAGSKVALPDGSQAWVVAPSPDAGDDTVAPLQMFLTAERLKSCLESVSAAEAWPIAWLVVQPAEPEVDLVMRIALDEQGRVATPEFLFTIPRRDWQPGDLPRVVRESTGRKPPRKGLGNLVVQGFSTRIVTTYVYEAPKTADTARGLQALLPPGSLIRDARGVELQDGKRYTLALVLQRASFVPSECRECASTIFGHADTGIAWLILADAERIVDRIDLTPRLRGVDGKPLIPRYACDERHAGNESIQELLSTTEPMALLKLSDIDGDGSALEVELPAEQLDCDRYVSLVMGVRSNGSGLEIVGTRELRP